MKLRKNEYCPIHRSLFCCGREKRHKEHRLRFGVQRIEDSHHPRGYRELRSPAEMRRLLNRKIAEQGGRCAICHKEFAEYSSTATSSLTIGIPKEWEERGEMIIRTTFKPRIGGAIQKKGREDTVKYERSVYHL
jgi:hypothetical protein